MTTIKLAALELAVFKALTEEIKTADTTGREALIAALLNFGLDTAVTVAELPDGTKVATATLKKPSETVKVTDERALLRYVREHHPDELEERVRPAFITALKDQVKKSGEIVPGLDLEVGEPGLAVSLSDNGKAALLEALRARRIDLGAMLALEAGDAEAEEEEEEATPATVVTPSGPVTWETG